MTANNVMTSLIQEMNQVFELQANKLNQKSGRTFLGGKEILNTKDLAVILGKSQKTICRWCVTRYKDIPMKKIGSSYYGRAEELKKWFSVAC